MQYDGKTVVITGNPYGIGRAAAHLFRNEGARIVCIDDGPEGWGDNNGIDENWPLLLCNVSDAESLRPVVEQCSDELDRVDVLFNLAGQTIKGRFEDTSLADWGDMLARNLTAAFLCSREFLPLMKKARGGCIIHHASIDGMLGNPSLAAYSAAKGGLAPLAHVMAHDLRAYGIRVNCISTGGIRDGENRPGDEALIRLTPSGRLGTPEDVAHAAAFLASDGASYINGINLVLDGGRTVITQGCYGE